jgi:hypothetical protein
MVRFCRSAWLFIVLSLWAGIVLGQSPDIIKAGNFSAEEVASSLPSNWEPLHFKNIGNHTRYQLVKEGGDVVVKAFADGSASGLICEISVDPEKYPIIRWRWKVMNILRKGNVHRKEGDDYPARIYIAFQRDPAKMGILEKVKYRVIKLFYGRYPPRAALNYIWASKADKGMLVPNPYTDRAMMIVAQSGGDKIGRWITEERNYCEDYKRAFEENPPMVSGVAIMTDTDNTGESATAYYGDILFQGEGIVPSQ